MAKSKHRLGKSKKRKRSPQKKEKLAPKKIEKTKPRNKAVIALLSAAIFIKTKVTNIFAAFKAVAKGAKERWRKIAVPVKAAAITVKTKGIKAVFTVKAAAAAANVKRLKMVASVKAVVAAINVIRLKAVAAMKDASASMKTKWLPIAGVMCWNYIIAPVLAMVIVMKSRPRYMAAALLLLALPAIVITVIAVSSPRVESGGAVPVILAANNEVSDVTKSAEVNAKPAVFQGKLGQTISLLRQELGG